MSAPPALTGDRDKPAFRWVFLFGGVERGLNLALFFENCCKNFAFVVQWNCLSGAAITTQATGDRDKPAFLWVLPFGGVERELNLALFFALKLCLSGPNSEHLFCFSGLFFVERQKFFKKRSEKHLDDYCNLRHNALYYSCDLPQTSDNQKPVGLTTGPKTFGPERSGLWSNCLF